MDVQPPRLLLNLHFDAEVLGYGRTLVPELSLVIPLLWECQAIWTTDDSYTPNALRELKSILLVLGRQFVRFGREPTVVSS